jgi:hypothetical protein
LSAPTPERTAPTTFRLRVPDFAEEITERLAPDLVCRDGKLSQLWVCANRVLGAKRRGRATDQTEHARRVGEALLVELS